MSKQQCQQESDAYLRLNPVVLNHGGTTRYKEELIAKRGVCCDDCMDDDAIRLQPVVPAKVLKHRRLTGRESSGKKRTQEKEKGDVNTQAFSEGSSQDTVNTLGRFVGRVFMAHCEQRQLLRAIVGVMMPRSDGVTS